MILILTILYSLIAIWVTINAGFKGGIPFTNIEFNNNKIALFIAILCGLLWPILPLLLIVEMVVRFFQSLIN
jgi:hypothetical protein